MEGVEGGMDDCREVGGIGEMCSNVGEDVGEEIGEESRS